MEDKIQTLTDNNLSLEEFRAERAKMAAAHGRTLEEEMDELEKLAHSKGYADCFRELYGIPVTPKSSA